MSAPPPLRVAGVVLAAGEGRRFGRPKAVVELEGERLVDRAVRVLRDGGCADVLVVSGAVALDVPGARVVPNPDWAGGMASSLRAGVTAASAYDAVLLMLVDLPGVTPACVARVRDALADRRSLVVATYDGHWGHPVGLGAEHAGAAAARAVGDAGARAYLREHAATVRLVECGDVGTGDDVDHPGDLGS